MKLKTQGVPLVRQKHEMAPLEKGQEYEGTVENQKIFEALPTLEI